MDKFEKIFNSEDFGFNVSREVDDLMRDSRREALQDALSRVDDLDDCWAVFRQSITETLIDDAAFKRVVCDSRVRVGRAIVESEYDKILKMAVDGLIKSDRLEVLHEAALQLLEDPKETAGIKKIAVVLAMDAMREGIQRELRESMKSDPTIIDEVKRELKLQIMGL